MKRMLINATQEEELRMAMVDGQRLFDLNIEGPASERKKANIYKGKITRVEPSLEAAFVDYGAERHGFLPLKEISAEYFVKQPESGGKPNIREVLKEGQDIVVQIDKEERGNKGAALTTYVSLAGRFIVLKPNKARSGGVSRRIVGSDRDAARRSLNDVEVPDGMSVILRTAGIDRTAEELKWDLENLLQVWHAILNVVLQSDSPFLIYRESNAVSRALRDYMTNDVGEILIDDEETYKMAIEQVESFMPHNVRKLKFYEDPVPLFTRFQIESQIESAFAHSVNLPSGGSIVIDHTEALVAIDINSARATKGGDIEATALNTNLEAAEEIARQLRIRDLGGLIVIDFIDMGPQKNQREVENRLRDSVRQDRARVQIGKITRFGLLEMSRQRLRPSIGESAYQTCPRCSGFGTIRSNESLALAILRLIGEEARKERTAKVIAQLPVEVATYLLNEKRDWVQSLESSNDTQVVLVANSHLETPHYDIRRVRDDQTDLPENAGVSYSLADVDTEAEVPTSIEERKVAEQAAIGTITPSTPAPQRKDTGGFINWMTGLFSSDGEKKKPAERKKSGSQSRRGRGGQQQQRGRKRQDTKRGEQRGGQRTKTKQPSKQQDRKKQGGQQAKGRKPKDQKPREQKARDEGRQQQPQQKPAAKQDEAQDEQKRPARSRRSRGGRRRRRGASDRAPRDDAQTQDQTQPQNQAQDQALTEQKPAKAAEPKQAEKPKADKPNSDKPKAEKPKAEKPKAKEARADKPKTEKPKAEKPKAKEAKADKPKTEKPKADKPKADKPKTDKPAAQKSDGNGAPKSGARLLPWEPAEQPASKPADKPKAAAPDKKPAEAKPAAPKAEKPASDAPSDQA